MKVDFRKALARRVPVFMPDLLSRVKADGTPVFPDFAAVVVPTEFAIRVQVGLADRYETLTSASGLRVPSHADQEVHDLGGPLLADGREHLPGEGSAFWWRLGTEIPEEDGEKALPALRE